MKFLIRFSDKGLGSVTVSLFCDFLSVTVIFFSGVILFELYKSMYAYLKFLCVCGPFEGGILIVAHWVYSCD